MRTLVPLLLLLTALAALPSCTALSSFGEGIADAVGPDLPASQGDLDDLRAHVDAQDQAIRDDLVSARSAGQTAYEAAIAEGQSAAEAQAAATAAEIARARADAAEAREKAEQAQREAAEGGGGLTVPETGGIAGLITAIGLALLNRWRNGTRQKALASAGPKPA
jgi:hypothetical protein